MIKRLLILIPLNIFILGCGTIGGFNNIRFPISKAKLEEGIDSLYSKNPEYKMPGKWSSYNDWSQRGYDFLESRIFYFNSPPEEMYYVTFVGDSAMFADTTNILIAIRAINKGSDYWYLNNDLDPKEQQRIQNRFDSAIISKLELYTDSKVSKEN